MKVTPVGINTLVSAVFAKADCPIHVTEVDMET